MRNLAPWLIGCLLLPCTAFCAEWGGLTGRLVVAGDAPEIAPPKVTKDKFCINCKPVDQSIRVAEDGSLANAVVWLRPKRGESVPLPPDDPKTLAQPMRMANSKCVFTPHITLLRTGQKLIIANDDPTGHNTKLDLIRNPPFNQLIAAESQVEKTFAIAESKPLPVACNIHPFMQAYILLRDDPYMAVTDAEGRFVIEPLPAGEHEFQFWHETGYLNGLSLPSGGVDRRGRASLTIPTGQTLDLGDISVPAELLYD